MLISNIIEQSPIVTDNLETFFDAERIRQEKISLGLANLYYNGKLAAYMKHPYSMYQCEPIKYEDEILKFFNLEDSLQTCVAFYSSMGRKIYLENIPAHRKPSLYDLLQTDAEIKGIENTEFFLGMEYSQAYGRYNFPGQHFTLKTFLEDAKSTMPISGSSYAARCQEYIRSYYNLRFPNDIKLAMQPAISHLAEKCCFPMFFDFCNPLGQTVMKVIKYYRMWEDNTFVKGYIPLTRWFCKKDKTNFVITAGLPDKQILMNLPQIEKAMTVVVCLTLEDAFSLQKSCWGNEDVAFTSFICDNACYANSCYSQVDFSPLRGKMVKIFISNNNGDSLAETYQAGQALYEYLRKIEKFENINFIQREVIYPPYENVFDIDALVTAHRKHPPEVIDGSVIAIEEKDFPAMLHKAKLEIERKREQSRNFQFWKNETETNLPPAPIPGNQFIKNMIMRPFVIRGTTMIIESAPGMGKSCFATALCAQIAGSDAPFLDERCICRCSMQNVRGNKIAYLVFDADGADAIIEHREDFASDIGENDGNFIQKNMAGDSIDYSQAKNYCNFTDLLDEIKNEQGVKGQPVDVLVIDTLLAFTHNKSGASFDIFTRLNKDFPNMAIIVIHHLNLDQKTFGGTLATMGPRVIIKLCRTSEQEKAIKGRKPTLNDPFTIEIEKFNTNKIAEDGESFELKLDEANHFVVVNKVRELAELRRLLIQGYSEKYELNQDEIGRLFGTTGRTIRNWLNVDKKKG